MVPFVEAQIAGAGTRIPAIGLGTMTLKDDVCIQTVRSALQMGYRHLDTATFYGNEREVGEGLRASGVPREDVFVTTKVRHVDLKPGDFERAVENSLNLLGLPSVDLLLIHWPSPELPLPAYIPALCKAKRTGQTKHIGVANFTIQLLDDALKIADEPLVNNQIEAHPMLDQSRLIAHCRTLGLSMTAYCPIGRGKVPGTELLDRIGAKYGKSGAQVSLRWLIQQGLIPIPRTSNPDKLRQNLNVFDFTLSDAEMAEIAALKRPDGRIVNPPQAPKWDS
jgi:diketogulonate reductase-like aldo/keto reductase